MVSKSIVRLTGGAVPARTENELGLAGTEAAEQGGARPHAVSQGMIRIWSLSGEQREASWFKYGDEMTRFVYRKDLSGFSVESGSAGNREDADSSKPWDRCGLDDGRDHGDGETGCPGGGCKRVDEQCVIWGPRVLRNHLSV